MLAIQIDGIDNQYMSIESDTPWGEQSFERERQWYAHLDTNPEETLRFTKADYSRHRQAALDDPEYDLFDHLMPTDRPKHDIGRYVMRHGIRVPIIASIEEWQAALHAGTAMLRSELRQDYAGYSGLLSSMVIPQHITYPLDERGFCSYVQDIDPETGKFVPMQTVQGPVQAQLDLSEMKLLRGRDWYEQRHAIGGTALRQSLHNMLIDGLYDGSVNPTAIMRLMRWQTEELRHCQEAAEHGYMPQYLTEAEVSRWRYIPGINVRVFRDPVIEGKYYIGGRDAHHHWEVTDGRDSPDVEAYDKGVYRGYHAPGTPEYTLPTQQIIDLYEKVRTLPYFDQRQAPVMEFQYGDDGELYFLQYLKTGRTIGDPGEFSLPVTDSSLVINSVRGATAKKGEQVRVYIEPRRLARSMKDQAIFVGLGIGYRGHPEQVAVMQSRIAITYGLNFKDNHWTSTTLTRPPVALGLWDSSNGAADERFTMLSRQRPQRTVWEPIDTETEYINAHITSNGRQAVIDSDWELRTEQI